MERCKQCIHEKVCLYRANILNDTYAYMSTNYQTDKCKHFHSYDVTNIKIVELIRENESLATSVNEASELIHKLRSKVDKSRSDVAMEIFAEIERIGSVHNGVFLYNSELYNLKNKYIEKGEPK